MADNNRNRQESWRQHGDWNDESSRQQRNFNYEDEPNYTISENRGYRDSGRHSNMNSGDSGWQSRYERQMNTGREGDFDYGSQHNRYEDSDRWGSAHRGQTSGYSDFGGNYSRSRNLYDRGYEGMGRRDYENRENRIGGANYDRYGDYGRYDQGQSRQGSRGYSNSGFGYSDYEGMNYGSGRYYGSTGRPDYGRSDWRRQGHGYRDYGHGEPEERSWWDRTADEVSSWFGDEDAERRRERDRQVRGMYRGKGPKNYSRSDDRIKEDVNDRLSDDPFIDASDIDVSVTNGEVTLTGTVDHRSTKRRAEDIAESISGVKNVENRLRVGSSLETVGSTSNSASESSTASSPVAGSERSRKETGYK